MDLNPSEEQQQLIDTFAAFYEKECPSDRVRADEPLGYDPELWTRLCEMGALLMAIDEGSGGWGASLLDLALVAEQHGRRIGPVPLIETQVAARLLGRIGSPAAQEVLQRIVEDNLLVTFALHPPRGGKLSLVPSGAVADTVVYFDGKNLRYGDLGDNRETVSNLGSMPLADVEVGTATVDLEAGDHARWLFDRACDEWLALTANALVGLGSHALQIGVEYVKERRAFGVPIGSFQSVSHGLADAATAVDGAQLISREAAWAADEDHLRAPQLASFACGFAAEAAQQASYRSLHYHGGYGFMLEYDVQMYFRRAKAWPAVFGEPSSLYRRGEVQRLSLQVQGD
jgi:alkylation response protein AidB-like acyl-CoA dehydrogenase